MASKNPQLKAEKRTVLGKAVKKLRREGMLPANVYGKDLSSIAIQVDTKEFETLFKQVGETGLVDLQLDGKSHPVLVKNLQLEYPLKTPLHVDFYQVNLKEKVKSMVPLIIVGEAKAVSGNIGLLLQQINEVEVEALPTDLPENVEVNVENLEAVNDQITVSMLPIPDGVTVLTDGEQIVVKIAEPVVEEPEEETPEEGEAGAEGEGEAQSGTEESSDSEKGESDDKTEEKKEE